VKVGDLVTACGQAYDESRIGIVIAEDPNYPNFWVVGFAGSSKLALLHKSETRVLKQSQVTKVHDSDLEIVGN